MAAVGPGRKPRKPASKPVDKLTKPELLSLVKRLHKRIARLEAQLAPAPQRGRYEITGQSDVETSSSDLHWTPPWAAALTNSFEE